MEGSKQDPPVVVAGEASESDEDEIQDAPNAPVGETEATTAVKEAPVQQSEVIVSGEASESDEEYEVNTHQHDISQGIPPLNVETSQKGDIDASPLSPQSPDAVPSKSKYNSLLCRKLRERNIALRRHLVDTVHQSYTSAGKDLHNVALHTHKSHITMQDVSYLMRETSNVLFRLQDKLDVVGTCTLIPDITIPDPPETPEAKSQA